MRPVILIWRPPKSDKLLWGAENFTATNFFLNIPTAYAKSEVFTFLDAEYYNQLPIDLEKNEIITFLSEDYLKPISITLQKSEILTLTDEEYLRAIPTGFAKAEISTFIDEEYLRAIPTGFAKAEISTFIDEEYLRPIPAAITKNESFSLIDEEYVRPIPFLLQKEETHTFTSEKFKSSIYNFYVFEKNEQINFLTLDVLVKTPISVNIESSNEFISSNYTSTIFTQFIAQSSNEFVPFNSTASVIFNFSKDPVGESFVTGQIADVPTNFFADNTGAIKTFLSNDSLTPIAIGFNSGGQISDSLFVHHSDEQIIPAGFLIPPFLVEIPPLNGPETKSSSSPDLLFYKNLVHLKMEGVVGQRAVTDLTHKAVTSSNIMLVNSTRFINDQNNLQTKAAKTEDEGSYIETEIYGSQFQDKSANTALTVYGSPTIYDFGPFSQNLGNSVYFNGSTDYLETSLNAINVSTIDTMTYEFWIYPKIIDSIYPDAIFSNSIGGSYDRHYCQIPTAGNSINYVEETGSGISINVQSSAGSIQNNTWTHVAIVRKNTAPYVKIFINGTLAAQTSTGSLTAVSNNRFLIGRHGGATATANFFRGHISNLRVVKGTEVYTTDFAVPKNNLSIVANTRLLVLQDDTESLDLSDKDFTIEGWWSPLKLSSDGALIGVWSNTTATSSWLVSQGIDSSQLAFSLSDGSKTVRFEGIKNDDEHDPFSSLGWYHWAVVRRNDMLQGFVNGKNISSFTGFFTGTIKAPELPLRVATISDGSRSSYGYFDDIRITKGIARYYDDFIPPRQTSTEPPILPLHLLHFDDTASTQFIDQMQSNWTYYNAGSPASSATITSLAAAFGSGGLSVAGGSGIKTTPAKNILAGDFTIEAWINPQLFNTSSINTIISQDLVTISGFTLYVNANSVVLSYHNDGSRTTTTNFLTGAWYHLVIQRENTNHLIFINGKKHLPVGSGNRFSTASSTLYVGAYTASSVSFNGYIDELRISNFAKYTEDFNLPALAFTENINDENIVAKNLDLYFDPSNSFSFDRNNPGVLLNVNNDGTELLTGGTQKLDHASSNAFSLSCSELDSTATTALIENIDGESTGEFAIEMWLKVAEGANATYTYSSTNLVLPATISSLAPTAQPNVWDHIVLSRSGSIISGYKNSILWGTGTDASMLKNIQFGNRVTGTSVDIGNLRMYNRGLSDNEIAQNYNAQRDRFYKPEVLIKLDYEESPNLFDRSAYNYQTSFVGSATVTTTDFKFGLSCLDMANTSSGVFFAKGVVKPLEIADFTFETWFKQRGFEGTQSQYLVCACPDPTSGAVDASDISISLESDAGSWKPKFSVRNNGTLTTVLSTSSVSLNTWNNIAITRSGGTLYAFLNGNPFAVVSGVTTNFYNSSWHLGNFYKQVGSNRLGLIGRMDSTRLLKNVCLYTGNYTVPETDFGTSLNLLTVEGGPINEFPVFAIGQIGESFFTRLISPFDVYLTSLSTSGINSVVTAYSPDQNSADSLPINISSMPSTGTLSVSTLYSPEEISANELPISMTPAN